MERTPDASSESLESLKAKLEEIKEKWGEAQMRLDNDNLDSGETREELMERILGYAEDADILEKRIAKLTP